MGLCSQWGDFIFFPLFFLSKERKLGLFTFHVDKRRLMRISINMALILSFPFVLICMLV